MVRLGFILLWVLCLSTAAVSAQDLPPPAAAQTGYAGVCPGSANPPAVDVPAGQAPARITWPGFQMLPDQSSRVFLQASVPFAYSTESQGTTFSVTLGDVRVAGQNNGRPLETRFFNTPVLRSEIKRIKKQLVLVLDLRSPVAPRVHTASGPGGYFFLYIDFPPGQYIEAAAPQPDAAAVSSAVAPAAPARPADPLAGGAVGARASGSASASGMSDAQMRALESERPPSVRASGGGSINLGGGAGR